MQRTAGGMRFELDHAHSSDGAAASRIISRATGCGRSATYNLAVAAIQRLGPDVEHLVTTVANDIVRNDEEVSSQYRNSPGGPVRAVYNRLMSLARYTGGPTRFPTTYRALRFDDESDFADHIVVRLLQEDSQGFGSHEHVEGLMFEALQALGSGAFSIRQVVAQILQLHPELVAGNGGRDEAHRVLVMRVNDQHRPSRPQSARIQFERNDGREWSVRLRHPQS